MMSQSLERFSMQLVPKKGSPRGTECVGGPPAVAMAGQADKKQARRECIMRNPGFHHRNSTVEPKWAIF